MRTTTHAEGLSTRDKRLLGRIKLGLWAVTLILVIHALPGGAVREAFPITRWAMFSEEQHYPANYFLALEVVAVDAAGSSISTTAEDLFLPLAGNGAILGARIVTTAVESEDAAERAAYQQTVVERIRARYDLEPVEVEVYAVIYAIDLTTLPHVDYAQPAERNLIGAFTL
jgi:hypothetical protein